MASSSAANTPDTSSHGQVPAFAPTQPHPALPSHKPPRILACVLCQHRKIKCDRNFPCANCTKAQVKCTPSTPAPARKRRRPNQDLQERLARCEELLKEYATEKPDGPTTPRAAISTTSYEDNYLKWQPAGKLIQEDGNVRFMDNPLLGTVYDELRAMREIIDSDDLGTEECATDSTMTPDDNSDLLFGGDSSGVKTEALWPDASHVIGLWQIYLDRVNPLTKIIHVPTMQPFLVNAVGGPQRLPKNIEALLFSVFLMAVVSLEPDECQSMLGCAREDALERFSTGVRLTLLRIGFLKTHDLTVLQALVIYLISLQGRYNRHAAWILNGVVIRIAQKMGLHRDGERLGLSPFEAEMRRRVWWQIIMVDSKYAIFSGLSHSLLPRGWDTKTPKNVNDADIFPTATEPFQDREGPTEMIFVLLLYKFAKFLVETPGFDTMVMLSTETSPTNEDLPEESLMEYRRTVENLGKDLLDILDKWCDPMAGRIHEMAIQMRAHIIDKIMELITPAKLQPEWGGEVRTHKDNTFKVAVCSLEHNETNYVSTKDKGFMWFSLSHFQMDIFLYMAGQLCHRTEGTIVERAWRQVQVVYTFHPELLDTSNRAAAVVAVFILKAWKKREEVIFGRTGMLPEPPFYIEKLRASMPDEQYKSEPTPPDPYTPASLAVGAHPGVQDGSLDSFLGYLDASAIDWDMFGAPTLNGGGPSSSSFGAFGVGPSVDW
ncbi:fungal-specific transcription factor domain-containing protein [Podospora australis]|uniref:Fungal-specific transcription factor domain-containing protein n=1 Tax=Podospora australis TaxID=1536484 RepID=A0AAN6X828_9PEZI|nr:fungal-specific transcription factor domain-containing protein [Podospora australis]